MGSNTAAPTRIGIVGYGFIGQALAAAVTEAPDLSLAFVWNRSPEALADLPRELVLDDLGRAAGRGADLIVEVAHPDITREHGARLLAHADYMPVSVSALVDDDLRAGLAAAAAAAGRRVFVPAGALMGLDALRAGRGHWAEVTITFRKHPRNLDFSASGVDPSGIAGETVLYDGPVRGIARLYPRNINTMITCALATTGLDACRGRLVADPALDIAIAEVEAVGTDGATLSMVKRQPVRGVSGTEMIASILRSVGDACGSGETLTFV
ncbi:MAG: DUF108 domain-containing protein [Azospirillaceae bacterium]